MSDIEKLRYPIGPWKDKARYSQKEIERNIKAIGQYTLKYRRLAKKLTDSDLAQTYRPDGWNVRQLYAHIGDVHILHFARFKQALSVEAPQGYSPDVDGWNRLREIATVPPTDAAALMEATHRRWMHLMRTMTAEEWERTYFHVMRNRSLTLAQGLDMVVWHLKHHWAHIEIALGNHKY